MNEVAYSGKFRNLTWATGSSFCVDIGVQPAPHFNNARASFISAGDGSGVGRGNRDGAHVSVGRGDGILGEVEFADRHGKYARRRSHNL